MNKPAQAVVVILPATGDGLAAAAVAARYARDVGAVLTVAIRLPERHPFNGWGPALPYPEIRFEHELDITMQLTTLLRPITADWKLLVLTRFGNDLYTALRELDVRTIFLPTKADRSAFSLHRIMEVLRVTSLSRNTSAQIQLVPTVEHEPIVLSF